ncbi:hypothetical protein B0H63DRAFT_84362 [Podospora didyma]|uniref:Uncharacterized protein n=1 Tax=Podospora didyma TaxID=330526 RepID=A0AAE0K082_9PEZI|nr:hypothetical protein B0H63DRAFT_84362 [Podospora didyma]
MRKSNILIVAIDTFGLAAPTPAPEAGSAIRAADEKREALPAIAQPFPGHAEEEKKGANSGLTRAAGTEIYLASYQGSWRPTVRSGANWFHACF